MASGDGEVAGMNIRERLKDHPSLNEAVSARGQKRKRLWKEVATHRIEKMLPIVHCWREILIEDGWALEPTYRHEPLEHAWGTRKDGFLIRGLARPIPGPHGTYPRPDLTAWGPDGMQIILPGEYDWEEIRRAVRTCIACGKTNVDTQRYSFAGRCCADCRPEMARIHEKPGWTK